MAILILTFILAAYRNTTVDNESLSLMKRFALSLLKIVKECFEKNMSIRRVRNRIGRINDGFELLFKYPSLAYYRDEINNAFFFYYNSCVYAAFSFHTIDKNMRGGGYNLIIINIYYLIMEE